MLMKALLWMKCDPCVPFFLTHTTKTQSQHRMNIIGRYPSLIISPRAIPPRDFLFYFYFKGVELENGSEGGQYM